MAEKLNKNRIRDTRLIALVAVATFLFTESSAPFLVHEACEFVGFMLVVTCVLGRLYSTTFIGGVKNQRLLTSGPFAMVRNPLYFFSLTGVVGIGLMSASFTVLAVLFATFYTIFSRMITREEAFLLEKFGKEYATYSAKTPRLWPHFKKYQAPQTIEVRPQYVLNAIHDCFFWFLPYFIFETIEWAHQTGYLPVLAHLP
jgi:protein-S-isoprenylcysteine O-methyltransferase Ste14